MMLLVIVVLYVIGLTLLYREPVERLRGKGFQLVALSTICLIGAYLSLLPFNAPPAYLPMATSIQRIAVCLLIATGLVSLAAVVKAKS